MKTVEIHELDGVLAVTRVVVRQTWWIPGSGPATPQYDIDLLGGEGQKPLRITVSPNGDNVSSHVQEIGWDTARRI